VIARRRRHRELLSTFANDDRLRNAHGFTMHSSHEWCTRFR
jgi:hypothetical protein